MGPMDWIQAGLLAVMGALILYGRVKWRRRMDEQAAERRRAHAERLRQELREAAAEAAESEDEEWDYWGSI